MIGMRLRGKVRVFATPVQRIRRRSSPDRTLLAIDKSYANAQCSKVNTGYNCHLNLTSSKRFLARKPDYNIPLPRVLMLITVGRAHAGRNTAHRLRILLEVLLVLGNIP
jgi:hypothetical protein